MEEIFKDLDAKFISFHDNLRDIKQWSIHDWSYYGASYGMVLSCKQGKTAKDIWRITQYLESGYMKGKELMQTTEYSDVLPWIEVLSPTNSNYKTDRK